MERAIGYFDRFELFQPKDGGAQRIDAAKLDSVTKRVDDWYDGFWDIAMKYNDGNIEAAEHFMNTSVFMFYYRMKQKAAYVQWHNAHMKAH